MNIVNSDVNVLGYRIYSKDLNSEKCFFKGKKTIISTINAYSYVVAKNDEEFSLALKSSDILLPDGFPIVYASKFLNGIKIKKIAGEDIFKHLLNLGNKGNRRFFFLGASNETLLKIEKRINLEYPNIEVGSYSPPFKTVFSVEDNKLMVDKINQFEPDVLFVGMTAPKQEKWVEKNKDKLTTSIICSVGAVFDFYAGTVNRPSKFWINLRLEWFIRLSNEPKRLWKRYLVYSPKFFIDVFKTKLGI